MDFEDWEAEFDEAEDARAKELTSPSSLAGADPGLEAAIEAALKDKKRLEALAAQFRQAAGAAADMMNCAVARGEGEGEGEAEAEADCTPVGVAADVAAALRGAEVRRGGACPAAGACSGDARVAG